ncbi:MAG TPA: site-2 protease family protein [Candidatus Avacidaminococcus intestinavium]|uniref:Site-2 protease family protein n=1 Tax=Candidatus Avacidaminococcus intestinavium TaxID=2840684 RepID=A0A9D1MR85_9FIRM|nr:site-2 protease family protein [Candidatus Avacidaminococcus intestinavium]
MLGMDTELMYRIPALLIAITVHEYAHAVVADSLGDPTPKASGRLTLNPLAHLDPIGALMLAIVGFGWAKPVSINPTYFRNFKDGMKKVAFAGPGANFFLAFLAALGIAIMKKLGILTEGVYTFLFWTQLYNVWFAFFNLLPLPPLDGSKILMAFLTPKQTYEYLKIEPYSLYIMIGLLLTGIIGVVLTPLSAGFMGLISGILSIFF